MRHLSGVGVEYCYDWVIEYLLEHEVESISEKEQEEMYMQYLDSAYGHETNVGFLTVNTGQAVKDLDPVSFDTGIGEYFSDDEFIMIGALLFRVYAIEEWVNGQSLPESTSIEGVST